MALAVKDLDVILGLMTKKEDNSELAGQLPEDLALEDVALLKEFVMSMEVALTAASHAKDFQSGKSYPGDHLTKVAKSKPFPFFGFHF